MELDAPAPLAPEDAARLADFARACKGAARAVTLYPGGHPAIATTLGRLAHLTSTSSMPGPLRMTVLAHGLLLDGRSPLRPDAAIAELGALLHEHLIGAVTVHPGGDVEQWRNFLLLVARAPDAVRAEGGIARVWTAAAGRHVELREIDYAEVLRERAGGETAGWNQIVASCLRGEPFGLDDSSARDLLEAAGTTGSLGALVAAIDAGASHAGLGMTERTRALVRLLQGVVDTVSGKAPDRLLQTIENLASVVGRLSPDMLVSLLSQRERTPGGTPGVVDTVIRHMPERAIASFVARNALSKDASIERVAQAFHSLVPDGDHRERLLALAHDEAADSALGGTAGFEGAWDQAAETILSTYTDAPFVTEEYAHELSSTRTRAIGVEHVSDDPPERIAGWLDTVSTSMLRKLDVLLVLDMLRIEENPDRWATLMRPVVALIEDLLLVGDFDAAGELLDPLVTETRSTTSMDRRQAALTAIDALVTGSMMPHIVTHLPHVDDTQFERVKAMCLSVGEVLIRPLAEALSTEERARPRERMTTILVAFGSGGRREVERLKTSPNPAVRRTAVLLLRNFGGSDALAELTELLADTEPQVHREAVRAILSLGTERAYAVLRHALVSGTTASRNAILETLDAARNERAAPMFAYILRNVDHRGPLASVYLRAIEALAALRDPVGLPALKTALGRGEWWAPGRTRMLRTAAAGALARMATPEATAILDDAARTGSRGVRRAARAQLKAARRLPR